MASHTSVATHDKSQVLANVGLVDLIYIFQQTPEADATAVYPFAACQKYRQ